MSFFSENLVESFAPNVLELIIMPTEQCCFRCVYCYEDFKIGKMNKCIQEGIIKLIESRKNSLDMLYISWFGGEPLMAKDIIYSLSSKILNISKLNDISYTSSMTTNAYLLDINSYEHLVKLGVRSFQITLDGPKNTHDKVRKRIDGEGTFDTIMTNLKGIKSSSLDAKIRLRVHYKPDTWRSVLDLIDLLKNELLDDDRFDVDFHSVGKWGGVNDNDFESFSDVSYSHYVKKKLIDRLSEENCVNTSSNKDNFYICYAAKANRFVIRANGKLAKCTVALYDDKNDVGYISPNGKLHIKQDKFKQWLVGFHTGNKKQLSCPMNNSIRSKKGKTIDTIAVVSA